MMNVVAGCSFLGNSREQDGNWQQYRERVSGPQIGRYASGRPVVTAGVDLKGKINSAVARPPELKGVAGICLDGVDASSSTSFSAFSVEAVDWEVSRSTQPKHPPESLTGNRCLSQ